MQRVQQRISLLWPDIRQETLIGIGFTPPYLHQHSTVALCMPEAQGALYWPDAAHNRSCLISETSLPFADNAIDRIILAHVLEYTAHPHLVMREIWRILSPSGKLIIIAPNRLGAWAHMGRTPFSTGRAFHLLELQNLLQEAFLFPLYTGSLLFAPPILPHALVKSSLWENIGNIWLQPFGGILIIEGEKQLYSTTPVSNPKKNHPLGILVPAAKIFPVQGKKGA